MGVIQRQSIKQSLVNYFAVAIAAISIIFIYPQDKEVYGLARFVIDTSMLIAPFLLLGLSGVSVRFFPQLKQNEKSHRGFLFFLISGVLVGSTIFLILCLTFKVSIYKYFSDESEIFLRYFPYLVPIAVLMAFIHLFYAYSSNFKRIVVPSLYQNLIKIILPLLILLFIWGYISMDQVIYGILANFVIVFLGMIAYLYWLGELKMDIDFSFLNKERKHEIKEFALFSLFSGLGSVLAFRIDSYMISKILDFESNGTFAIAAFIANVIAIPTNAIGQISAPIVSESFKNNDLDHIRKLYKESSINLLVFGLLIFVCIAASIEDLFLIMPKGDQLVDGVTIVLVIGAARIIDMGTSINNQIINYSKHYRFGFYAILLMAVFNIITNAILIPKYQIIGAAIATLASLTLYNLIKMLFIKWRLKMQPFNSKTLIIFLVAIFVYGFSLLIPGTQNLYLDILIRSIAIGSVYTILVYYLKVSEELNNMLDEFLKRINWTKK